MGFQVMEFWHQSGAGCDEELQRESMLLQVDEVKTDGVQESLKEWGLERSQEKG